MTDQALFLVGFLLYLALMIAIGWWAAQRFGDLALLVERIAHRRWLCTLSRRLHQAAAAGLFALDGGGERSGRG